MTFVRHQKLRQSQYMRKERELQLIQKSTKGKTTRNECRHEQAQPHCRNHISEEIGSRNSPHNFCHQLDDIIYALDLPRCEARGGFRSRAIESLPPGSLLLGPACQGWRYRCPLLMPLWTQECDADKPQESHLFYAVGQRRRAVLNTHDAVSPG